MTQGIFSVPRFAAYLKKHVFDNRSRLCILALTVLLVPILLCVGLPMLSPCYDASPTPFTMVADPMWNREVGIFTFLYVVAGALFGSSFYEVLTRKTSRISLFTLPVSSLEKFAAYFCLYAIIFPLFTLGSTFLADAIRVWFYSGNATPGILVDYISLPMIVSYGATVPSPADSMMIEGSDMVLFNTAMWLTFIMTVPALFTLGSSVWPKNSFLKTTAFLFGFNTVSGIMLYLGVHVFFASGRMFPREFFDSDITAVCRGIIAIASAMTIFLYAVSYFRMKEWEVIDRW